MKSRRPKSSNEAPSLYDIVKAEMLRGHCVESIFGREVAVWPDTGIGSITRRVRDKWDRTFSPSSVGTSMRLGAAVHAANFFEVDDSALVTALAMRPEMMTNPRWSLPDLALVPHAVTWLEYNPRLKVPEYDPDLTSRRVGHLIVREADGGGNVTSFELGADGKTASVNPYTFAWDGAETWETYKAIVERHYYEDKGKDFRRLSGEEQATILMQSIGGWEWSQKGKATIPLSIGARLFVQSELLTGKAVMPWWGARLNGILHGPEVLTPTKNGAAPAAKVGDLFGEVMAQSRSAASLLMAILALVAWCPQQSWVVGRPAGRFWHRSRQRPYSARTRVVVKIPLREVKKYLKVGAAVMHKRRHSVREHFRRLRSGEIVRVREHMRGDAALGTVVHDYNVRGGGGGGFPGT